MEVCSPLTRLQARVSPHGAQQSSCSPNHGVPTPEGGAVNQETWPLGAQSQRHRQELCRPRPPLLLQNSLKHLPHHSSPGVKDRVAFYRQGPTLLYFFIFQHLLNSSPSLW